MSPMAEMTSTAGRSEHRLAQAAIVGVCLLLVLAAAACSLGVVAASQGSLTPPTFSVRLGQVELAAPCPAAFQCDINQPYYSIWRGDDQPDGSIKFHQLYFIWLPKKKP